MRRSTWGMLLVALCVVVWAVPVMAQPGQGGQGGRGQGRGGFGGGRGGFGGGDMTFNLLRSEEVRTELAVSEEQQAQITALQEEMQASQPDFRAIFAELGEDATEEERNTAMAEMRDKATAHQAEARAKLAEILAADQLDRLRQIRLQVAGLAALRDAEVIEALGITEEQQAQIAQLLQEQNTARRELGFQASEEDRAAFNAEWNGRIESTLTAEQRDEWTVLLGDTFEFDRSQLFGGRGQGGFGGPGGQGGFGGPGGQGRPGGGQGRPGGGRPEPETEEEV